METTSENSIRKMPKITTVHILAIALAVNLALTIFLFANKNVRAALFSADASITDPSTSVNPAAAPLSVDTFSAAGNAQNSNQQDMEVLLAQLQQMQGLLQASTAQLDQKMQVNGLPMSNSLPQTSTYENIPALEAEIEELYQVMQPLMAQLETAAYTQSTRSATEISALRAQVDFIHQRLDYLLSRLEIARANGTGQYSSNNYNNFAQSPALTQSTDQAAIEQLYQNMMSLQNMMLQMQNMNQAGQ